MDPDSAPHEFAGDIEKGQADRLGSIREEAVSPVETVSGRTLTGGSEALSSKSSPRSPSEAKFPWKQRVASWVPQMPQKSPSSRHPTDMAPEKEPIVRCLEDYPEGYPRMSCYLDSDEQFMIYRRFGTLHSRCLMYAQDELRELEGRLESFDRLDNKTEANRSYLMCRENDDRRGAVHRGVSRAELLATIKQKTLEYGQLLIQAQQLCAMNKPSSRDHRSVTNYIENEGQLMESISRLNGADPPSFVSPLTRQKTRDPAVRYYTRSRINLLVTGIITAMILALLIVPIWILYTLMLDSVDRVGFADRRCIGVILIFTLVFSAALSTFTKARRHEILAAAAGYCAVLVVFIGNVS